MKPSTQKRWQETRELLQEALHTWDSLKPTILAQTEPEEKNTDKMTDKIHDEKLQDLFRQLQEKIKNLS